MQLQYYVHLNLIVILLAKCVGDYLVAGTCFLAGDVNCVLFTTGGEI
jgi:hypothetical protein